MSATVYEKDNCLDVSTLPKLLKNYQPDYYSCWFAELDK